MARRRQFDPSWVPETGTVLDGRYRLDEMVDRGGMGVIMRGEHIGMKRDVAVKLLSPDIATEAGYRARFRREVDLAATIEHPNIVRCYDFGETEDGVLYLVMELLEGRSLKDVLAEEHRMSTRRVANLMVQVLDGMSRAHLQGIVHRDLKPSNIYIVRDHRGGEVVKVLDFGLAKSLTSDHLTLTKTGAICGTASYVAPESLVLQQIGTEGDVYAVGLIMLEMLIGRQMCQARAMAQTFLQHLVIPARIPRRVWDTELGQVIARAVQKHPDDRYATAEEMYQALTAIPNVPEITLEPAELPPLPRDDLDNRLLLQLGEGKYASIDALREMPVPEPWDLDADEPDDTVTERHLMVDLDRLTLPQGLPKAPKKGSTPEVDKQETPRVEAWADEPEREPSSEQEALPPPQLPEPRPVPVPRPRVVTDPTERPPNAEGAIDAGDGAALEASAPPASNAMVYIALALAVLTLVILILS